jgi:hypothetical protein
MGSGVVASGIVISAGDSAIAFFFGFALFFFSVRLAFFFAPFFVLRLTNYHTSLFFIVS